jgi:proteasome lid subunit RPN8/RPN11
MTVEELKRQINSARVLGDHRELVRLQDQYRRTAMVKSAGRSDYGGSVTLGGSAARASLTRAPAVQAPSSSQTAHVLPPTSVHISWKLHRSLREIAAEWSATGLESGGFLFGKLKPDCFETGTLAEILEFSRPRLDDKREASRLHWDERHLEEALSGQLSDLPLVGDWHTHPTGVLAPSEADLKFWRGNANEVSWRAGRAPGYIGMIIGPGSPGGLLTASNARTEAWFMPPLRWDGASTEPEPLSIKVEG